MGLVVSDWSKLILIIAVKGAANNIPVIPQSIPQKINARIMVTGCNPNAWPNNFGSNILPIAICTKDGSNTTKTTIVETSYCKKATGNGNKTAIIEPKVGIKFNKNVKVPKMCLIFWKR